MIKGRNFRKEEKTSEYETQITGLLPQITYAVNVFLVDLTGKRGFEEK